MKAIQVKEYVGVSNIPMIDWTIHRRDKYTDNHPQGPLELNVTTLAAPQPTPDQYTLDVHATSTNFFDLLQIAGKYQYQPPLPWTAGHEFAGIITAVPTSPPNGKAKFRVGDRVFGAAQGGYAQQVVTTEASLRPVPEANSLFEAAGFFTTMPTSYAALVTRAQIKAGEWVLVHAAAGGVGLAAVQIAKAFGAKVIATAGTQHKLDVAKAFGADHGINYRDADWPDQVRKLTPNSKGVDIVYDPVGLIDKSMKCIGWCGRLVVIGFVGGTIESIRTNKILLKNISVMGLHWGAYSKNEPEEIERVWEGLFELFKSKKIQGTNYTDKEYVGLESVPEALRALGARETWGKVVVKVPQGGGTQSSTHQTLQDSKEHVSTVDSEPTDSDKQTRAAPAPLLVLPSTTYTPPSHRRSQSHPVEQLLQPTTYTPPTRKRRSAPAPTNPNKVIYFTPLATKGSKLALSEPFDPLPSPAASPTPTKESFNRAEVARKRPCRRDSFRKAREGIVRLGQGHLEKLARAFVEAPVVKEGLYRPLSGGAEAREGTGEAEQQQQQMRVRLRGIALTDSQRQGAPVVFATERYRDSPNVLNVGGESFLNQPYGIGYPYDCCVHVERSGHGAEEKCKVLACIIDPVVDRWTGNKIYDLVAEVDITEAVISVVLAEIAQQAGMSDVKIEAGGPEEVKSVVSNDSINAIDWCALADDLQSEYELDALVETASSLFSLLDATNCTSQTLALLADLERLKRKHQDFVVVSTKPHPTNPQAAPARAGVPWISEHFETKLHSELPEEDRRAFRAKVVVIVAQRAAERKPFSTAVALAGKDVKVFCAPLEAVDRWAGDAWVCFVGEAV
ncbi:uncharacterized protein LTR77_010490 [Saxophila tyrrhenica]|uniref:Enoyl reductase (ER) domain-containing protein n=1 Tax=Saxophila tyrrhenica TaxID=1690608 RepID=A0AAV9NY46_9PEZI|nr:hypothetical protein LTR77_010490 [Saxophila tyrrhenica]